jgi:hypothetical protein
MSSFSCPWIRIRIHKVTESGSNPDPDPQPWLKSIIKIFQTIFLSKIKLLTINPFTDKKLPVDRQLANVFEIEVRFSLIRLKD